jgi:bifunctional pyridoxal-dependent enzyme with beta-cystathionase and maltose regulon repressor activities
MVAANNVIISPGPVFSLGGGLDKFVRLPWTRPANELQDAVERIAIAWHRIEQHGHHGHPTPTHGRFIVV